MLIVFLGLIILVLVFKRRPRRVVFQIRSSTRLGCGCVLDREEVSGQVDVRPCAAHQAIAERL